MILPILAAFTIGLGMVTVVVLASESSVLKDRQRGPKARAQRFDPFWYDRLVDSFNHD